MNKHGIADEAFIYIADSAMVTEENLTLANRFITRLPATYKACDQAIASAVDEDQWVPVGCIAITPGSKKKPSAKYRLNEQKVTLYDKEYRAIVVHSSAHDSRRAKRLIREMSQSLKSANAVAKKFEKKIVFCQADAEEAMKELMGNTTQYHQFKTKIVECPRYSRGRPKQGATRAPIAIDYKLLIEVTEKTQEIAEREKVSGCFVLITNVEPDWNDGYDPEKILRTYKEQYGIENNFSFLKDEQYGIENNFSFLKDDQFVNAIFLKRPEKIEAIC